MLLLNVVVVCEGIVLGVLLHISHLFIMNICNSVDSVTAAVDADTFVFTVNVNDSNKYDSGNNYWLGTRHTTYSIDTHTLR